MPIFTRVSSDVEFALFAGSEISDFRQLLRQKQRFLIYGCSRELLTHIMSQ